MEYTTLTPDDRLMIARDRLRGLESDHYRLSIDLAAADNENPAHGVSKTRLAQLEDSIQAVNAEIAKLEG